MLAVLRRPAFTILWLGSLVSLTGDWVLMTGLPLVVYAMTGSTLALGVTAAAGALPRVLVASFAGVFVDRWDRRQTMLVCNLLLGLSLLPLLVVDSAERLWLVAPVLLVSSTLVQFYKPAEVALLPRLVPACELGAANALNGLILNLARLIGPALGAVLAAWLGLAGIALLDAASFLIAGVCVAMVRVGSGPAGCQHATGVWREWLDGLRAVRTQVAPRVLIAFLGITGLGEGIMGTLMVPFATRVMHGTELTFGALVSAQAIGGLVGSGVCAQLATRFTAARLLGLGALLLGAIDLLIFYAPMVTPSALVPVGLMATVGVPAALVTPSIFTLFQTRVRDEQRGRIIGAGLATLACSGLLGMLLAGWLGDRVGIVPLLTVQSLGYIVAGSMVLRLLA